MADYQTTLLKLNKNLHTLQQREAKFGGDAPVALLNQITDHQQAIALTEQASNGELSEAEWREALRPLLISIRDRSEKQPDTCGITIGDVEGGIIGSILYKEILFNDTLDRKRIYACRPIQKRKIVPRQ